MHPSHRWISIRRRWLLHYARKDLAPSVRALAQEN
ncbi:protein of unknown function [Methylorubrum extorquens]|uniref:Uncharacterized protein n=1 Tax=Methylorubrum extorquens TaxID=408 RepID=A0A2N9APK1_METEX|nr:protein of unknown function [Methylorubrum extorquens]